MPREGLDFSYVLQRVGFNQAKRRREEQSQLGQPGTQVSGTSWTQALRDFSVRV